MLFVDSNIPMYLVGGDHPLKYRARALIEAAVVAGERLVSSAEVLQEILHRYVAIRRLSAIEPTFELMRGLLDDVVAVENADVERAKTIVLGGYDVGARDALHIAVMERLGTPAILSFDQDFDRYPGISRRS